MKVFKIIVVGDSNVGKTSLTYRFCEGKCLAGAEATIGVDFREKVVTVDGEEIKVRKKLGCLPYCKISCRIYVLVAIMGYRRSRKIP